MNTLSTIKYVRAISWMLFAVNSILLLNVKGQHGKEVSIFFMISIGLGAVAFLVYCIARLRKQTETTRNVIEAITPLAMLGAIVIGIIILCVLVPMLIGQIS